MPRVPFALRKNVSPIGSRMASSDGASSPHSSPIFLHKPAKCPSSNAKQVESWYFSSLKLFNLSAPLLKIVKIYVGPYRSCKSNRKIGTSIKVWFFCKEVRWRFNRRPQRASWRVGASDPPLYSCQNLRIVWKKGLRRRFLWFKQIFTSTSSPHLQASRRHTFLR